MNRKNISKILIFSSILIVAILLFVSIIKNYVSHTHYSEYQKVMKEKGRDVKQQIYYLRRAVEYSPSNAEILFKLGKAYIREMLIGKSREDKNKSYEQAKEFFQKALMHKPTDGRYWAEYAWYIGRNGEADKAVEYFNKAVHSGAMDAYVHSLYARWCVNQVKKEINVEDTAQFAEMCIKKQELDEVLQSYDNRFSDGVSIATFLKTAQVEWDRALSLGVRKDKTAYNSLADLNLLICELDKAIGNYNRANNKIMLARCYLIKGDYSKAVNILGAVIKGGNMLLKRDLKKIQGLLMVVIKEDPENYQSFYRLGEINTRLKMIKKAITNFKKAVELNPKYTDAHLKLAKLYDSTGKTDLAIEEYETVLSLNPKHKEATGLLSDVIRDKYKEAEFIMK